MDQSSFRAMLTGGGSSGASSSRSFATASTSSKQRLGFGLTGGGRSQQQYRGGGGSYGSPIPDAPSKSSVEQFRPRQSNKTGSLSKGKEKATTDDAEDGKGSEPSYKRFGYADRASMRRAGLGDDPENIQEPEDRRPRGLDLSKLDASRRALLTGTTADDEPPQEPNKPLKTDEEIERELAEEEERMEAERARHDPSATAQSQEREIVEDEPPAKKQKKSRADMLRDLQAKIAAASSGATAPESPERQNGSNTTTKSMSSKKKQEDSSSQPSNMMKGFKVAEQAPVKKRKKKGTAEPGALPVATQLEANNGLALNAAPVAPFDDDDDIFAGAGAYDDGLSADEDEEVEVENTAGKKKAERAPDDKSSGPAKYFEDQDEDAPKFQAWRSPTPPPRRESQSPSAAEDSKPKRLEGLSTSQYTAKDLLERDNALAREEKRKLRKLKGKDRKEAMAAEAAFDGKQSDEQKQKDRLNREAQEYESYEKKKRARLD